MGFEIILYLLYLCPILISVGVSYFFYSIYKELKEDNDKGKGDLNGT